MLYTLRFLTQHIMLFSLTLLGIISGIAIAIQSAINSGLRRYLRSPFLTSAVSFTVGSCCLALACLATGQHFPTFQQIQTSTWWLWIGGALGVVGLTSNILIFPQLGAVQTAIMPILGQMFMGLLIDQFAWFHTPQQSLTAWRILGVFLSLFGIFLAVVWADKKRQKNPPITAENAEHPSDKRLWLWRLLGIVSGMVMTTQAAINGQLGTFLHAPLLAALWSFVLGSLILCSYAFLIEDGMARIGETLRLAMPKIFWSGGALGAIFVFGNTMLVPKIGAGQTVMLVLLGMIGAGVCVEHFGFLGAKRKAVSGLQLLGLLSLMLGVAMIRVF